MSMGEINLAKKMVWSARERRILYRWMLTYLLVSVILLPVVAYRASVKISDGVYCGRQAEIIQSRFQQQHPEQSGMLNYADTLRDTLRRDARHAAAVGAAFPHTAHSMLPLLEMLLHQNGNSSISRMAFVQEDRNRRPSLEFSLILPAGSARANSTALLRNWRKDPKLIRQFTAMVPLVTERGKMMNRDVLIMRCRAVFKEQ